MPSASGERVSESDTPFQLKLFMGAQMRSRGYTWSLVLAGGEGSRLSSLTTDGAGASVPKQFRQRGSSLAHVLRDVLLRAAVEVPIQRPRGVRLVGLDTRENRRRTRVSEITGTKLSRRPPRYHGAGKSSSEPGIREVKENDPGQEGPGPRTCTDRVVFHVRILPHPDFPRSAGHRWPRVPSSRTA